MISFCMVTKLYPTQRFGQLRFNEFLIYTAELKLLYHHINQSVEVFMKVVHVDLRAIFL